MREKRERFFVQYKAVVIFFLGLFLGVSFAGLYFQRAVASLRQTIAEQEQTIWRSNNAVAKAVETETVEFPSGELGINSDLFSSKQAQVTQWRYRGHEIFEYKVDFSNETSNIYVVFWKYKKMLPGERVIIGDGGKTYPLELSSNDYFITGNKLKNRWSRNFNKLTIDRDISSDEYVYIEIVNDYPEIGLFYDETQKSILESTRELEPIANSIILF